MTYNRILMISRFNCIYHYSSYYIFEHFIIWKGLDKFKETKKYNRIPFEMIKDFETAFLKENIITSVKRLIILHIIEFKKKILFYNIRVIFIFLKSFYFLAS